MESGKLSDKGRFRLITVSLYILFEPVEHEQLIQCRERTVQRCTR